MSNTAPSFPSDDPRWSDTFDSVIRAYGWKGQLTEAQNTKVCAETDRIILNRQQAAR